MEKVLWLLITIGAYIWFTKAISPYTSVGVNVSRSQQKLICINSNEFRIKVACDHELYYLRQGGYFFIWVCYVCLFVSKISAPYFSRLAAQVASHCRERHLGYITIIKEHQYQYY